MRKKLENRLIQFSIEVISQCKLLEQSFVSEHLSKQIIRSSSSAALNFGETQGAESHKDFIHKMSIVIKELRETFVNLRIILGLKISNNEFLVEKLLKENNELISIFYASIKTARKNAN